MNIKLMNLNKQFPTLSKSEPSAKLLVILSTILFLH